MDRSRLFTLTTALLVLSWTAASHAQEGGQRPQRGGFGGGFGGAPTIDKPTLLASSQVREELKIKDEQAKKIDEILAAHRQESSELFSGGRSRDLSAEEREKRQKESMEKRATLRKKTEAKLETSLEKDQLKRLGEIELQQQGIDGLASEPMVAALKLTKEQVEKIRSTVSTRDEEVRKLMGGLRGRGGPGAGGGTGSGGDFQEMREKTEKLRKEAGEKGLAVLSKEQREELDKLKGKPFELDRRALFGGRGNRPGGQGRGRGEGGGSGGEGSSKEKSRPPEDDK